MIFLNGLRGVEARVMMPKGGAWFVDLDLDLEVVPLVPSGRAVATIGLNPPLIGTIDDRASGRFGSKAMIRLVAGGAGWDKPVPALHLHNDAGVLSTAVYSAIGAAVQETVVELVPPKVLGADYAFMRGSASSVFAGVDWWVDAVGITHVGPRIPLPMPPIAEILHWDPKTKVAEIASDILIVPGMLLVDPIRFGVATVDDVEHTFREGSARAIAWCSTPSLGGAVADALLASPPPAGGAKFVQAMAALARQACGVDALKSYPYRVVTQGPDGRMILQLEKLVGDAPPLLAFIDVWAGIPGVKVKPTPSTIVLVKFIEGDRARPVVVGFDPKAPPAIEISFAAIRTAFGLGTHPVAKADAVMAALSAIAGAGGPQAAGMQAALSPLLPTIPSPILFTD